MKILPLVAATALGMALALPSAAQSAYVQDTQSPAVRAVGQDRVQDPDDQARTRALNAEVVARLDAVDQNNAEVALANAGNQAAHDMDLEAAAGARATYETDLANYEEALRASSNAEAQYQNDMQVWRERVRDCERGVRAACSPN